MNLYLRQCLLSASRRSRIGTALKELGSYAKGVAMSLLSQLSPHFWLLFSIAVSVAVLRELRRPDEDVARKKQKGS
ncbi:hypothetical protein [Pseudomonas sp. UBA7530]|uniref:hypothetical protein n=1 Tax=Pseudomonas sp. UBA7530 TaxID=1947341 RepID=UPI0025D10087|nr:hypothetical protein [Pseudomonas sp. UBA7530]